MRWRDWYWWIVVGALLIGLAVGPYMELWQGRISWMWGHIIDFGESMS